MSKKNKGWDYLNSDDVNSISDGSKGDWGYTKADGSGSFHGGDGSWNYKNADGRGMKAVIIVNRIIMDWKRFHRRHEKFLIDQDIKYINLFTG